MDVLDKVKLLGHMARLCNHTHTCKKDWNVDRVTGTVKKVKQNCLALRLQSKKYSYSVDWSAVKAGFLYAWENQLTAVYIADK